jgi:hypothetical protein
VEKNLFKESFLKEKRASIEAEPCRDLSPYYFLGGCFGGGGLFGPFGAPGGPCGVPLSPIGITSFPLGYTNVSLFNITCQM